MFGCRLIQVASVAACLLGGMAISQARAGGLPSSARITSSSPSTSDDAVVGLTASRAGVGSYCTGVLIDPRLVLTAAHCAAAISPEAVWVGPVVGKDGERIPVARAALLRAFAPVTLEADLALLQLVWDARPAPLALAPRAPAADQSIRIVGFGATGPAASSNQRRRQGTARVDGLAATSFSAIGEPSLTCSGDSGGPALIEEAGQTRVVGITSSGDLDCARFSRFVRVDAYRDALRELGEPFMRQADPVVGGCAVGRGPPGPAGLFWAMSLVLLRRRPARRGS